MKVRMGKSTILVRSGAKASNITITASCANLESDKVNLSTVEANYDMISANAYAIYDEENLMIDLGGKGQLVQFGWTPWIGSKDSEQASFKVAKLTNYVAGDTPASSNISAQVEEGTTESYGFTITTGTKQGVMRWLGEMNVIGKNGFVYGDGVLGIDTDGIELTIENLPAGNYKLVSYHHAPSSNSNSMDPNLERLKTENIHKLAYAKRIRASVKGCHDECNITSGKELQYLNVSTTTLEFTIKQAKDNVVIKYTGIDSKNGIWLNGFELKRKL